MSKWGPALDALRDVVFGQSKYLDLYEQATLWFIYRRTWYYGKEWEFIPLRHFMDGVWSYESGWVSPRVRISEKSLLNSLHHLEEKTIIEVKRRRAQTSRYRIKKAHEVDEGKLLAHLFEHQLDFARSILKEVKRSEARMGDSELQLFRIWERAIDEEA